MKKSGDIMHTIASAIVKYRFIVLVIFIVACVYCGMSLDRVRVNSDLTAFLPAETDTRIRRAASHVQRAVAFDSERSAAAANLYSSAVILCIANAVRADKGYCCRTLTDDAAVNRCVIECDVCTVCNRHGVIGRANQYISANCCEITCGSC